MSTNPMSTRVRFHIFACLLVGIAALPLAAQAQTQTQTQPPADASSYANEGDALAGRGDFSGAIAAYTKALQLTPRNSDILTNRASAYVLSGEHARAVDDLNVALEVTPGDASLRNMRAHARFTAGQFAGAAEDFDDVVARTPEYTLGRLLRYIAHRRSGSAGTAALQHDAADLDRQGWPWPMVAVYLGEMSIKDMRAKVATMNLDNNFNDCGVSFYLAEYAMIRRQPAEAIPLFKEAAAVCSGDGDFERDAAIKELQRIDAPH
jgi:lipoprotein NlpI